MSYFGNEGQQEVRRRGDLGNTLFSIFTAIFLYLQREVFKLLSQLPITRHIHH